jgi:Ca2+-binding EF-hand superfamily protein
MINTEKKKITCESFNECLKEIDIDIPLTEIYEMIKQIDKDGDEMICEKEFLDIMIRFNVFN